MLTLFERGSGNYNFPDLVSFHGDFVAPYKLVVCGLPRPVHSSLSGWSYGTLAIPTQMTWSSKLAVVWIYSQE